MSATIIVNVELPEPLTLVVVKLKLNPVGPAADKDTVPVNPICAVTVIVEVPRLPAWIVTGEVALIPKSGAGETLTLTVAE